MRAGLLALQHNVCLLRDPDDPDAFYPRIEAERTSSFAALEPWARDALAWLMDDYFNRRQETLWREHAPAAGERLHVPTLAAAGGAAVVVIAALALAATDPKAEDVVLDMFAGV